jgi:N-acetylmuramoyl-L-alanine amidase
MRSKSTVLASAIAVMLITGAVGVPAAAADDRVVVVRAGQTLSQIAVAHGTTVERLVRLNHLADENRIYPGQRLRMRPAGRHRQGHVVTHRVAYGETLTSIAHRYHVPLARLARRNHLADASRIYAGQPLRIRWVATTSPRSRRAPSTSVVTHVVRFAETLSGIALHYRVDMDAIVALNDIANPSLILVGQQLRVPAGHGHAARHHRASHRPATPRWNMPAEMAALVRARAEIGRIIRAEARTQHVPVAFARAVAWQESGWQPGVVSSAGAIGVMQLLPATADWVAGTMLGQPVNLWSARSNVRAGVALLRHYLSHYGGSRSLALAAYYQGQAGTDRNGIYPMSRPYIDSILILESMFAGR